MFDEDDIPPPEPEEERTPGQWARECITVSLWLTVLSLILLFSGMVSGDSPLGSAWRMLGLFVVYCSMPLTTGLSLAALIGQAARYIADSEALTEEDRQSCIKGGVVFAVNVVYWVI